MTAQRRVTPKQTHIEPRWTITEAGTWIISGERCADAELHARQLEFEAKCIDDWRDPLGPEWLLPFFELMLNRRRRPWMERKKCLLDVYEGDAGDAVKNLKKAREWLKEQGETPAGAYEKASQWVAADRAHASNWERFYQVLSTAGEAEAITVEGKELAHGSADCAGVHAAIPCQFFIPPVFHWRGGKGPFAGKLSPAGNLDLEEIFQNLDKRSTYLDPRIKHSDVLTLKGFYDGPKIGAKKHTGGTTDKDQRLKHRISEVLTFVDTRWGPKRPPIRRMADHIVAQKKNEGFSASTLRQIISGRYPSMERLGIKV